MGQPKTTRSAPTARLWRSFQLRVSLRRPLERLRNTPPWQRFALMLATSPFLLGAGASGAYYLRMHQVCETMSVDNLPRCPTPSPGRRVLVLAPHCDDETLGAGSLIADARRAGVPVRVAFFTNGDGFRVAASRALGEMNVGPTDYVRFAERRQDEAIKALSVLGVPSEEVRFMGYPDQGLKSMWENNWDPAHPYRSPFTKQDHCPYHRAVTPNASYCGESVVSDLERLMDEYQPTEILVTHPADDHPDHSIAAAYAQAALRACRRKGRLWAGAAELRYYIVHRGDWPLPQGRHPERPLAPPPGLVSLDTSWSVYTCSPEGQEAKRKALEQYVTQTSICGRFLRSFDRRNELFASLPEPASEGVPGAPGTTASEAPDSSSDNVARFADAAADITEVGAERQGDTLRVQMTLRGPVSSRILYRLRIRTNADATTPNGSRFLSLSPRSRSNRNVLEATVPLSALGLDKADVASQDGEGACLWIAGETRWGTHLTVPVDRTGYRAFSLQNP